MIYIKYLLYKQVSAIAYNSNITNEYEIDRIRYSLECIYSELSKLIILLLISLITNTTGYFIIIFFSLFARSLIGGTHFKTYYSCLLATILSFLLITFLSINLLCLNIFTQSVILILLIIIILNCNYRQNPFRPKTSIKKLKKHRYIAISFILVLYIFSVLFCEVEYINCTFLASSFIMCDFIFKGVKK